MMASQIKNSVINLRLRKIKLKTDSIDSILRSDDLQTAKYMKVVDHSILQ